MFSALTDTQSTLFGSLLILLVWAAAWTDLKTHTIPHIYPILAMILWVPVGILAFINGMPLSQFALAALGGVIILLLGFIMFIFRAMGAGDTKLLAALAPFIPFMGLFSFFVYVSIAGFFWVLAYLVWSAGKTALQNRKSNGDKTELPKDKLSFKDLRRTRCPYGPAIAIGFTFYTLTELINI